MHKVHRKTPVTENRANRFSCKICAILKNAFDRTFWVAASPPCKDFVMFRYCLIATNLCSFFLCHTCFFVIFPLLSWLLYNTSCAILASLYSFFVILDFLAPGIVLKQAFSIRIFPKNTAHKKAVVWMYSLRRYS